MSTHPDKSAIGQTYDAPDLTGVAEPDQGNARPNLRIRIPGGKPGGEDRSVSQADQMPDGHTLPNVPANRLVPRQASQISQQNSADDKDKRSSIEASGTADQEDGLQQHDSSQLEEESPALGQSSAEKTIPTGDMNAAGYPGHSGHQPPISSSSHLNHPYAAGKVPHTSNAQRGGAAILGGLSSAEDLASPLSHSFQVRSVAEVDDDAHQEGDVQLNIVPRSFGGRHGYETNSTRGPPRRLNLHQAREATHTNSRTWIHPKTREQSKWVEVHKNLKEMSLIIENPQSPYNPHVVDRESFCVPKNLNEWIEHRKEYANDRAREARQRLYAMQEHKLRPRHSDLPPPGDMAPITVAPFGGREFRDGRSAVLAMPTTWTPWKSSTRVDQGSSEGIRPQALWPCPEEMREEGNERNTSQFGRFMPLPRAPGNPTVNWKQKKVLPMRPFDEIWKLPTREIYYDQRAVTSPGEMKEMESMIGQDLLAALDCDLGEE